MQLAAARNGTSLPVAAIPILDVASFCHLVAEAVAGDRRLLFLGGLERRGEATRLLAALADDGRGEIGVCATDVDGAYPALTPAVSSAHYFEREIFEQWGVEPQGHPWLKPVRFPPG